MIQNIQIILLIIIAMTLAFYVFEFLKRRSLEKECGKNSRTIKELDEQAKLMISTDLALNKVQQELDKKIAGLYALHELGKKINATFSVENLFSLVDQPLISRLGFSKALVALKDEGAKDLTIKSSIGYTDDEIISIQKEINKDSILNTLLKQDAFFLVNVDTKKIENEELLSKIFNTESFLTVPLAVKTDVSGFIFMGNSYSYAKVTQGDKELLSVLASQIGTAIENTNLYTEIFNSYKDLERRVQERTKELAKLNDELKRLNKMKSDFVSAVSHELRTPLTSIKGYASILMAGKLGAVSPEQKKRLEKIDKHSNELTHLVNDLLDISRIESGRVQMVYKEISIKDMLDYISDIIMPQVKEKNLSLKIHINTKTDKVKADASQLERVFLNLISNAVKFTPEKGKINVFAEDRGNSIEFRVEDTGIGIPRQDLDKVFEEFFRSNNAQEQKIKGTGLGLSLVKKIIEAHKGKLLVDSEVGKGTTFSFTIPQS
ncbi:MAG: ATP-binding protein [Candidatus Omnitrophota bacterium]